MKLVLPTGRSSDGRSGQLKRYKAPFWIGLDERFGFGFAAQRNAAWLIASGPLTTAALVYGAFTPMFNVTVGFGL